MSAFRLLLDPGHGGHDYGAVNEKSGLREKDVVLSVASFLEKRIIDDGWAVVGMTRRTDRFVSLSSRVKMANEGGYDLMLSIHCNSAANSDAHGFEVFTSKGQTMGDTAAGHLFRAWKDTWPLRTGRTDLSDGDVDKEADFAVLRRTQCPSVLFEMEFIHTDTGAAFLADSTLQSGMAMALEKGLMKFAAEIGKKPSKGALTKLAGTPQEDEEIDSASVEEALRGLKKVQRFLEGLQNG